MARSRGGSRFTVFLFCVSYLVSGQIHYRIPEELEYGAFVGNIVSDLMLNIWELSTRNLRLVSEDVKQYIELNREDGALFVNGRIDREQLCRQSSICSLFLQIALDNPLEIHRVVVEIRDVNDNSPSFSKDEFSLEISESIAPGTHFPVESAQDPDVGINTISTYHISPNDHFGLKVQTRSDGSKSAELLLEKALDREQQSTFQLILTAIDGGTPHRSGTVQINISVLDSNDNAPVFDSELYRATVLENAPKGALVIKINAADKDKGSNGELTYSFTRHVSKNNRELFKLDPLTGEIRVQGVLDFEESSVYELDVEAVDRAPPGLAGHAKVIVGLTDVNDNAPKVEVSSVSSSIPEDAPPGTVIALISVSDFDSEINGQIQCQITDNVSFKLQPSSENNYKLVSRDFLDREDVPVHNISISAWDGGSPPLSTYTSIRIAVSDINDNAPVFTHSLYNVYLTENNAAGASIFRVTAADSDKDHNSDVSYSILENGTEGGPGYVTINSKNGDIYSLRSFDYEQLKQFQVKLQARDAGSPPLSSSAVLNVIILDQNDNEPIIVSPLLWNSSAIVEIESQQMYPGYLIMKIIAMDADSGQNGRLSYQMLEATNPQLFNVDSLSGEIRTTGSFGSQDLAAEKLVLSVKDNGQPRLSSTVTISFSILLNFTDNSFEFTQEHQNSEYLNFYLIILLGSTSLVFLLIIILLGIVTFKQRRNIAEGYNSVACCYNRRNSNITLKQRSATTHTLNYSGPDSADGYGYTVCLTPESSNSEFMFLKPCSSTLPLRELHLSSTTHYQISYDEISELRLSPIMTHQFPL
ncbi:protocadherin-10-like [Mobula hypostoma]|uniref:protocadherin-10-like n=1 Tax=Mobula hypostoma TaxID=723540 RepID=UPI002FC3700E